MKIGLHLSMLCKNWTDDTSVYLEELKKEGYELEIKLSSGFYDAKGKYKKYKEYASIEMTLYASKITWNWY